MKIAALDLGTNSFLCLIVEKKIEGGIQVLHDEMRVVRLGQGLGHTKKLHPEALKRADGCLKMYAEIIRKFQVDQIHAVATAAAREAENSFEFLEICQKHQIPITTISGQEEALMSFQGSIDPNENKRVLLIDIGGGSTEYIVGQIGKIEWAQSLPYGAVKLTEQSISSQPVSESEEKKLRQIIRTQSEKTWTQIQTLNSEKIWAVAGTPTSLVAATIGGFNSQKIDGYCLSQSLLKEWIQKLRSSSVEENKIKYGFGDRADVIFAGAVILDELLERLNSKEIFVSTKGIRYGLAHKVLGTFS